MQKRNTKLLLLTLKFKFQKGTDVTSHINTLIYRRGATLW